MQRYDVALWRWWPSLFPAWCEVVEAASAFAAVEVVMRRHGCMTVKHAAARTMDGLVVYRCFGVQLSPGVAGWRRVRRSSILGSLRHGGAAPAGSKRCRQARPLTQAGRLARARATCRGVAVNAVTRSLSAR